MTDPNPLVRDRDVEFLLHEVLDAASLCALPAFAEHDREGFDLFVRSARRLAREELFPAYRAMDQEPPRFEGGRIFVHPRMHALFPKLVELGLVSASSPALRGGQQLPRTVATFAHAYLMAGNAAAYGYVGLTAGAAHLLEAFADDALRDRFLPAMQEGRATGTMALTEPQAGSSLADVATTATLQADGTFRIRGSKIFISGGDHDLCDNVVHMTLARIEGAPPGVKGISLFAVPKVRADGTPNDVTIAGMIHKIGWRGLPSLAIEYGDRGDCHGFLVGQPHRGLSYMFQMMNEARLMVGLNGVATASVAFHEARAYASTRLQGRAIGAKDPRTPQVPIVAHADVRRMLLRQKAIVEGGLCLIGLAARFSDLAEHAVEESERARSQRLLDLLTPIAKSFPAERGFEANVLAMQVHGGYGYSSEYLVEAWLRDQKLNSLHEGTTGIQALDLLGRKVVADGGAALSDLREEIAKVAARAADAGLGLGDDLLAAFDRAMAATMELGRRGAEGDFEGMLCHATDYLELLSILVIGWTWLLQAAVASEGLARGGDDAFYRGKIAAARYWFATEITRVPQLAAACTNLDDGYGGLREDEI